MADEYICQWAGYCSLHSSDKVWAAAVVQESGDRGVLLWCWGSRDGALTGRYMLFASVSEATSAYWTKVREKQGQHDKYRQIAWQLHGIRAELAALRRQARTALFGPLVHAISMSRFKLEPSYVYTVGLTATYRHPELILLNWSPVYAHQILKAVIEAIKEKGKLTDGAQVSGVPGLHTVQISRVSEEKYLEFFPVALHYHRGLASASDHLGQVGNNIPFEMLALVMPDNEAITRGMRIMIAR
jgi:hypothetical protein